MVAQPMSWVVPSRKIMPLCGPTCKIARFQAELKFPSWTECGNSDQKTDNDDLIELGTGHTVQAVVGHEDDEVPPLRTELVDCNNITLLNYNVNKANIKLQFKICMASPG